MRDCYIAHARAFIGELWAGDGIRCVGTGRLGRLGRLLVWVGLSQLETCLGPMEAMYAGGLGT